MHLPHVNETEKFLQYCGLTCFGGSEKKLCKCTGPADCEMRHHLKFWYYRDKSILRTRRLLRRAVARCVREGRHQEPNINPCPECGEDWKNL